jgi:flagellar motor switch protein FliG
MKNIKNFEDDLRDLFKKSFYKTTHFPFSYIFKKASPQILYKLIKYERNQTIAFILSFSRNKKFIDCFLDILIKNKKEDTRNYIIEYLNNCPAYYAKENEIEIERVLEKKILTLSISPTWIRRKWKLRPSD